MSTVPSASRVIGGSSQKPSESRVKLLVLLAIFGLAASFVAKYVFYYYRHYSEAGFTDPNFGASNYWALRGWLLMHITGGMIAVLTGPFQFWTGFRARFFRLHRWMGRIYLGGVAMGAGGSFYLSTHTSYSWAFGVGIFSLGIAWVTTAGMAYYAILKRRIAVHKEWMVRAYVVTFAFVTFRILSDYGPTSRLQPDNDKSITIAWACWALPLLITEVVLQLRRMRSPAP
jgi:uncharacterized membrane protein YozB (DUF420 family)